MKLLAFLACTAPSSSAFTECGTNGRGVAACNNGQTASGYNANTDSAWKAQKNQAGVTTTETSRGGQGKNINGKGLYKSPNGKTCYRGAHSQRCN